MKIKKNDTVEVITGKSSGKRGRVLRVYPETNKVLVEGVNILKKHERPSQKNQQGGITSKEHPINASNVMLVDSKGNTTRVGKRAVESATGKGRMERFAKKSGETLN
jgi:large subunit ribosomal protein L24